MMVICFTEHNVAHQTMDDLVIKAWLCPCCLMYSYSDPTVVLSPPIEPPTNTLAYDVPNDQADGFQLIIHYH